jgi:hypothetical protein
MYVVCQLRLHLQSTAYWYLQKLDNNLLTVEPRVVDPHCFDADPELDPDPVQNLDADPDPDPDPGGEGVGQPKM